MKQRFRLIILSCALLAAALGLFHWHKQRQAAPTPQPSVWGGYYDEGFVLTLSAGQGGRIYYTTDGSAPTVDSEVYRGGIFITDRSGEPNIYNAIENVVPYGNTYAPDPGPVPKGTVIRAIYVNSLGIQSEIFTQTYFVGMEPPERGYTLSLVFEERDLFGEDGLYATGQEYDAWFASGGNAEDAPLPNFQKRIEVPVQAEFLDGGGDILNQRVGLRLQGNSARSLEKKRFILTARKEYDGSQVFGASLFEGVVSHSVMLKDVPIDAMAWELAADRDISTQRSVPVRVYLNGEYWQDTYLLERYDNQYFRQHYNVSDRVLVKNNVMDEGSAALLELDDYAELMYWAEYEDFSDDEQFAQLGQEIDPQSYIDYICVNYYLCNYDFSQWHNCVLWRSPGQGGGYRDQRWRWCLYDIDALYYAIYTDFPGPPSQINVFSRVFPQTDIVLNRNTLFLALKENPQGRRQFVLSFMDIGNNNFSMEKVAPVLEKYGCADTWLYDYFRERPAYAAQHLAEEFDLTGTLETVTVRSSQPEMGTVQVNTSVIDLESGSWSGQYFTDYPITVTAIPNDGYIFLGWKGALEDSSETVTVRVEEGLTLEAVFAAKAPYFR